MCRLLKACRSAKHQRKIDHMIGCCQTRRSPREGFIYCAGQPSPHLLGKEAQLLETMQIARDTGLFLSGFKLQCSTSTFSVCFPQSIHRRSWLISQWFSERIDWEGCNLAVNTFICRPMIWKLRLIVRAINGRRGRLASIVFRSSASLLPRLSGKLRNRATLWMIARRIYMLATCYLVSLADR